MGYRLGIDLGTTFTAAAYVEDRAPRMLELGNRNVSVPSVLFATEDGRLLVGEAAERRAGAEPERVIREFKRRFGDDVPMVVAKHTFDPVQLQTELLRWVLRTAAEREAAPPDRVVVTHPANWGPYKMQLMRDLVVAAGVPGAVLCPEPVAAAVEYAAKRRVPDGARLAVYDLGGGTFDVAVLEKTGAGFTILGTPLGIEHLGGSDFNEAIFAETLGRLDVTDLDLDDPEVARGVAALRRECTEAKEALSTEVDTEIASMIPGTARTVRWSRKEFEALIRPALADTITTTARALHLAGVEPAELLAVVLVGGSSRIPLVREMLERELKVQVALDTYPKNDIALGAARYSLLASAPGAAPVVAPLPPSTSPAAAETVELPMATVPNLPPSGPPAFGQPAWGQPASGQPASGQPAFGQPAFGQPASGQPASPPGGGSGPPSPTGPDQILTPPGPVPGWMAVSADPGQAVGDPGGSTVEPRRRRLVIAMVIGVVVVALGIGVGLVVNQLRGSGESGGPIATGSTIEPTVDPSSRLSGTATLSPAPFPDPEKFGLPVGEPIQSGQLVAPVTEKSGEPAHLRLIDVASGRSRDLQAPSDGSVFGVGLSLDRRTITYVDSGANVVRTMAASGGRGRLLFRPPKSCGTIKHASWSPTDLSIFVLECQAGDERKRLMVVRIDGSVVTELDTGQEQSADPTLSPDGTQVAFWGAAALDGGDGGAIFVMPIDGSAPARGITDGDAGVDGDPGWSPDGATLAFRHLAEPGSTDYDVLVVPVGGGTPRTVLTGPATDEKPTWSPDGGEIVAVSNRDDDGEPTKSRDLWRIPAGGGDPVALDVRSYRISTPTWWHR